jgi:hypothetical protein
VSIVGIVVVTGIFYLLVVCAEAFAVGRHGIAGLIGQASPLGYLTSRFWSPSVLWSIDLGHPVPWCLHAGEPAAFHFSRLAPDRCHCRGHPAGATARHLPGLGKSRRTELDKQLEPD